jgi:hypothetical protein
VKKRLFFYRIHMDSTGISIYQAVKFSTVINPAAANSPVSRRKYAFIRTQFANGLVVQYSFIIPALT